MPKIFLKPNSPEFAEPRETHDSRARHCEMMGCPAQGDHKAPKNRGLNEYHYFCIDHVREYNQAWNFFSGMSDNEVQDHMMKSMYGDRPTWRYDTDVRAAENLRRAAWSTYNYTEGDPADKQDKNLQRPSSNSPEYQAMIVMGLEPPVVFEEIKTRYKELAKKHHPDLNRGCTESEERLKQINMAYTILKVAYEAFEKLPER